MGSWCRSLDHRSKNSPACHGNPKFWPGPRKNVPMRTSTDHPSMNRVNSEMANLRSSGLWDGLRSMNGARISPIRPSPGSVTPATIGWNIVNSSWRPRKYQGAFEGFGVWLGLAISCSGAFTNVEKTSRKAVQPRAATNSMPSRWGQTCTLSWGVALTSWIEPDLTTVSSRWVWPPGPVASGGPAEAAGAGAVARAGAVPPPPVAAPPAAALAARERSSRWAGMRLAASLWGADSPPPPPAPAPASAAGAPSAGAAPPDALAAALRRASSARLRRCSGISVMSLVVLRASQRAADAAVLADPPDVDGHEDHDHERQHQHVQHVPP